ncbi:MAG: SGNH/GDSL hydrolase family protein [Candidatus Beckwithbacteria bacterium]|nr:SGNH/GDSL hydrolase family protein [Candidatus Beckwithbacteria bacterium]
MAYWQKAGFIFSLGLIVGVFSVGGFSVNQPAFLSPLSSSSEDTSVPLQIVIPAGTIQAQVIEIPRVPSTKPEVEPKTNNQLKGEYKIALLGDSMIDTAGPGFPALQQELSRYFPAAAFQIFNYGAGATNLEFGLHRLNNDYQYLGQTIPALFSVQPDIIIIESMAYNHGSQSQEDLDKQWLTLGKIVETVRNNSHAKLIFLATIAPNSKLFAGNIEGLNLSANDRADQAKTVKLYLNNFINFAHSQNIPLINVYEASLSPDGEGNSRYISHDGLHPSVAGHELTAKLILNYFR